MNHFFHEIQFNCSITQLLHYNLRDKMSQKEEKDLHKEYLNVFSKQFTGGPQNLGLIIINFYRLTSLMNNF
jgi:hypothetical protein